MMRKKEQNFWLETFDAFYSEGIDVKKFFHGITTADILKSQNEIIQTCWLTPKGNLRGILEIHLNFNEINKMLIIILQGDVNQFREYCLDMIFPSDDINLGEIFSLLRYQEIDTINSWRKHKPKFLKQKYKNDFINKNSANILDVNALKQWKVNQAIPSFNIEIDGKNNPLELGLTDLVNFNKGCYLGQETMAKLKNVSSLKHEIRVWIKKEPLGNNLLKKNKIFLDRSKDRIVGYITSMEKFESDTLIGLAMIKKNYLNKYQSFISDQFGEIKIIKSIGSVFL